MANCNRTSMVTSWSLRKTSGCEGSWSLERPMEWQKLRSKRSYPRRRLGNHKIFYPIEIHKFSSIRFRWWTLASWTLAVLRPTTAMRQQAVCTFHTLGDLEMWMLKTQILIKNHCRWRRPPTFAFWSLGCSTSAQTFQHPESARPLGNMQSDLWPSQFFCQVALADVAVNHALVRGKNPLEDHVQASLTNTIVLIYSSWFSSLQDWAL